MSQLPQAERILKIGFVVTILGVLLYAAYANTIVRPPRFDEAYVLLLNRNAGSYSQLLSVSFKGAIESPVHAVAIMFITELFPSIKDLVVSREFSATCMAITLLFAFLFLNNRFGLFTAIMGCLMFTASNFFWFAATDGRNYALASGLSMCAVWAWDKGKPHWDFMSAILMLLGLLTHYFSIFVALACVGSGLAKQSDTAQQGQPYKRMWFVRLPMMALALAVFCLLWWPNIVAAIQDREGTSGAWNETLTPWRLLEYLVGLPWVPKAGVEGSLTLLALVSLSLVLFGMDAHKRKDALRRIKSSIFTARGILLVLLALPGVLLFVISYYFHPMDFVARYFFVSALGMNFLLATVIGELWQCSHERRINYILVYLTVLFLCLRVFYPLKGHYPLREFEARFAEQVSVLDSLAQHHRLVFDLSYPDFRFYWQVCWASPNIERVAIGHAQKGTNGPTFLAKYYQYFDTPRIVALADGSSSYDDSILISSNPYRAWNQYYIDVRFEPLLSLGEVTGGVPVTAFRILRAASSRNYQ